jgi:hypothetical protein
MRDLSQEDFEMEFKGISMEEAMSGRKLQPGEEAYRVFAIYKNGELSLR